MKKASILIFLTAIVFLSCNTSNKAGYSYTTTTYSVSPDQEISDLHFTSRLISYGGYLFEFKIRISFFQEMDGASGIVTDLPTRYDTIGVYLLDGKKRTYYEFDTFALAAKIVSTGKLNKKPFGQKLPDSISGSLKKYIKKPLKEILSNGIKLYAYDTLFKNTLGVDSVSTVVYFFKDPGFTSLYKLSDGDFINPDYCMVGFRIVDFVKNTEIVNTLESCRLLTNNEIKICNNIIAALKDLPAK